MAPVMFQVMSDLHLETHPSYNYSFKQTAPYLALLGDIGQVGDHRLFQFLEKQVKRYWAVFFLLGNHEPTYLRFDAAKARVREFERKMTSLRAHSTIGRFIFLDQTRYDVSNTLTILGCTLFSHVLPLQEHAVAGRLVDFRDIIQWNVEDHNVAHKSDLDWLNRQVEEIADNEPQRQIVIFTHHSPCLDNRAIDPEHKDSDVMSGFATDLRTENCWMNRAVKAWAFGHTHFNTFFTNENGASIISNQKGYYTIPKPTFRPERIYSLGE
ncbi:hypothetical protein McanMca71_002294 [Microsporum canis]|uniref:Ser/Thr protein phosphatase n=1 Tax=Arthroderma otae (strain ATCC MYA-4605 / CBS 113480) TaxID=554155 RepID=C5FL29_ARTOC|nr:ser/Thr protein phosphatase [Microsporum canis CBS 113480]EEQ30401.1 ser/Thr protein phosphatase [Microsporum canis CBS 113480]